MSGETRRGQANLLAVAVALVLLTSVLGATLAVAESALVGATAERDATDRHAASTLAARFVTDAPPSYPPNVIPNRSVTVESVESLAPVVENASWRIELGGRTLHERGNPSGGATVYRGVMVATPLNRSDAVDLARNDTLTLPHRTGGLALSIDSGPNTTVHTVRVNDRIVLHNETGLSGDVTVPTSRSRETELTFETAVGREAANNATAGANGSGSAPSPQSGPTGRVGVSYTTIDTEPSTLVVTVDV